MSDDQDDGGIYAQGCHIRVRPRKTASGYTMGGRLAQAQNPDTAREIARRCQAFVPLHNAALIALAHIEAGDIQLVAPALRHALAQVPPEPGT